MNTKRNIIFTLESRKKDGILIIENVPIRMRVNFASQRIEFTTAQEYAEENHLPIPMLHGLALLGCLQSTRSDIKANAMSTFSQL